MYYFLEIIEKNFSKSINNVNNWLEIRLVESKYTAFFLIKNKHFKPSYNKFEKLGMHKDHFFSKNHVLEGIIHGRVIFAVIVNRTIYLLKKQS